MVDLRRDGTVFILDLGDGENRFARESIAAIHAALDEIEGTDGHRALVTTGRGKFFSNGLDLEAMLADDAPGTFLADVLRILGRVLAAPYPTVAAINGHAFAGGAMLATAHDRRLMRADRGYWCINEVELGVPLAPGMLSLLQARLPRTTAHVAITSAQRYGGPDAAAAGIVDGFHTDDELLPAAVELAASLAGTAGAALGHMKADLYPETLRLLAEGGGPPPR